MPPLLDGTSLPDGNGGMIRACALGGALRDWRGSSC